MARQTPFPNETNEAASARSEPKGRQLVRSTYYYISSTANRSSSSDAEVTKSVTTWSDAPNGQQCGLHDNGVRNEFTAVHEAFETTCPVSRNIALAWVG